MSGADYSELPGVLAEIAEIAGKMAAAKVAKAKGGSRAYFPRPERLTSEHWLVEACGEHAAAVAERLGGGHIDVPLGPWAGCMAAIHEAIRRGIDQGLAEGKTAPQIAREVGVTDRAVFKHKARRARKDPRLSLLDF